MRIVTRGLGAGLLVTRGYAAGSPPIVTPVVPGVSSIVLVAGTHPSISVVLAQKGVPGSSVILRAVLPSASSGGGFNAAGPLGAVGPLGS